MPSFLQDDIRSDEEDGDEQILFSNKETLFKDDNVVHTTVGRSTPEKKKRQTNLLNFSGKTPQKSAFTKKPILPIIRTTSPSKAQTPTVETKTEERRVEQATEPRVENAEQLKHQEIESKTMKTTTPTATAIITDAPIQYPINEIPACPLECSVSASEDDLDDLPLVPQLSDFGTLWSLFQQAITPGTKKFLNYELEDCKYLQRICLTIQIFTQKPKQRWNPM